MIDACGDNRFEIIREAKEALIASTNITQSPKEMAVLNDFLFRCWQMGWLKKYEQQPTSDGWIPVSERLPDMENVLGTTEECEIKMVWYNPHLKKWFGSPIVHIENVTAWQPLPPAYKKSE